MNFNQEAIDYLRGDKFSSGLAIQVCRPEKAIKTRIQYLEELMVGKRVLHVGCVDHQSIIDEKRKKKRWLHERLSAVADRCLGVDINEAGIQYIKTIGFRDSICANIFSGEPIKLIQEEKWDYLILGEVLEHLDDPSGALRVVRNNYKAIIDRTVVTVPNATSWRNVVYALSGKEYINTDHRHWFSAYTLGKIAVDAGYEIENFNFYSDSSHGEVKILNQMKQLLTIKYWLQRNRPVFRESLAMVLRNV